MATLHVNSFSIIVFFLWFFWGVNRKFFVNFMYSQYSFIALEIDVYVPRLSSQ